MVRLKSIFGFYYGAIILFFMILLGGCAQQVDEEVGEVIFTRVPVQSGSLEVLNVIELKYLPGMQIARAEIGESLENIQILTEGFYSARAPEVSYDGKTLVFSGQKTANDTWQIWTLNLAKKEIRQVTQAEQNCTDPTWLPDGRIAYSKLINGEKGLKYHGLFSAFDDGSDESQITFQPHEDLNAGVLHDGRLIISSQQIYPELGDIKLLAVHPDGTKAELFYQPEQGSVSKVWESDDKLVFAESEMISLMAKGAPREAIARGVLESIADRVIALLGRISPDGSLAFTGGLSRSRVLVSILEQRLGMRLCERGRSGRAGRRRRGARARESSEPRAARPVAAAFAARLDGGAATQRVVPASGIPLTVDLPGPPHAPEAAVLTGDARFLFSAVVNDEATRGFPDR